MIYMQTIVGDDRVYLHFRSMKIILTIHTIAVLHYACLKYVFANKLYINILHWLFIVDFNITNFYYYIEPVYCTYSLLCFGYSYRVYFHVPVYINLHLLTF